MSDTNADRIATLAKQAAEHRAYAQRCDDEIVTIRANALSTALARVASLELENKLLRRAVEETDPRIGHASTTVTINPISGPVTRTDNG